MAHEGLWPAFAEEFPLLAREMASHRLTKNGAREFCCEMQRRESELMLGRIIPRIQREIPECAPVTIHDGILCQRRFVADVRRVMADEAERMLGVRASVKVKAGLC
jgi:hypothetical protein